jgi:hypothetical protein
VHLGSQLSRIQNASGPSFTLEALASVLEPRLISESLETFGKSSERIRKLPADLVMWLVIAMSLYRSMSIDNVLYRLVQGLGAVVHWRDGKAPGSDAVTKARARLGWEVVRGLFRKLAELLGLEYAQAHMWKGLTLLAIDGTTFMTPATEANESWFGRPRGNRGKGGYPRIRLVALMGAWSHLILAATFGGYSTASESELAEYLLPQIKARTLVLMDRLYYSFAWLAFFNPSAEEKHFLVRAKTGATAMPAKKQKKLGEGDWLGVLRRPSHLKGELPETIPVRILQYQFKGFRPVTLVTSLLDPMAYPYEELVALYHGRWEIELGYDEVKTHFAREQVVFRSKAPDKVLQEGYGLLTAYNCIRALMVQAASKAGVEPRRLSFVDCLVRIRFALTKMALAATRQLPRLYEELVSELATCVLPPRRSERVYPRAVKIKMSSYPLKRNQKGRGRRPRKRTRA